MKYVSHAYKNFTELADYLNKNSNLKIVTVDGQNALLEDHAPQEPREDSIISESVETKQDGRSIKRYQLKDGSQQEVYSIGGKEVSKDEFYHIDKKQEVIDEKPEEINSDDTVESVSNYLENGTVIKIVRHKDGSSVKQANGKTVEISHDGNIYTENEAPESLQATKKIKKDSLESKDSKDESRADQ